MDKELMRQQALQMLLNNQTSGVTFDAPVTPQMPSGAVSDAERAMILKELGPMSQGGPISGSDSGYLVPTPPSSYQWPEWGGPMRPQFEDTPEFQELVRRNKMMGR